jgi:type VI protein secretion system component Hcp
MDNAQLYLSLVRPSMIPVVGESADDRFIKQIEVTGWKWGFHNLDEQKDAEKKRKEYGERADFLETSDKGRGMQEKLKRLEADYSKESARLKSDPKDPAQMASWIKSRDDINAKLIDSLEEIHRDADLAERTARDRERENKKQTAEGRRDLRREFEHQQEMDDQQRQIDLEKEKFQFSFTKRIDLATTQMLNSMKAGDLFPLAIFTMHQTSANNPMSLVIRIEGLRLVKYGFNVDTNETMTDLKEEWTCDFKGFGYVYKNKRSFGKPSLGSVADAKQIAAKAATQGTVRAFTMIPKKLR